MSLTHSSAAAGNSACNQRSNSGVLARSSRLLQYSCIGPDRSGFIDDRCCNWLTDLRCRCGSERSIAGQVRSDPYVEAKPYYKSHSGGGDTFLARDGIPDTTSCKGFASSTSSASDRPV